MYTRFLSTFKALYADTRQFCTPVTPIYFSTLLSNMSPPRAKRPRVATRFTNTSNKRLRPQSRALPQSQSQRAPAAPPPYNRLSSRRTRAESQQSAAEPANNAFEVEIRDSQSEVTIQALSTASGAATVALAETDNNEGYIERFADNFNGIDWSPTLCSLFVNTSNISKNCK
jgi:hypothetical protein